MFKPIAKEELVGRTSETRNWGGMIISIIVIILICATIVIVAILVSDRVHPITPFEFDDIFNSSFKEKPFNFQWLNENVYILRDENNNIIQKDVENNRTTTLLDSRTWNVEGVDEFWISPSETHILLACHKTIVYRYSYTAVYKVYDISTKDIYPAFKPAESLEGENPRLRYASWSPDKNQPSLLLVYKNNIYYQQDLQATATQITDSGEENLIYNGIPDYTFEGDLLSSNNAIYWFKEQKRFVYATFNDSNVESSSITKYDYLIKPEAEFFPYAKPGGSLPVVTLHVVDLETSQTVDLTPPSEITEQEYFYKYVVWRNRFEVSVTWLNRAQNYMVLSICNTDEGTCELSIDQRVDKGWIVLRGPPVFDDDGGSYAIIRPLPDRDGIDTHYHVHVVTIQANEEDDSELWTEGKFEVTKIVAYEKKEGFIYFLANKDAPSESQLYRVSLNREKKIECLSCGGSDCTYFDAERVTASKFVLNCRGPGIPKSTFHDFKKSKTDSYTLENNTDLYAAVDSKVYLKQESEVFEVNGISVPVRILYHNRKDKDRHHPLLIHVLDKPGSHMVKSEFYSGWYSYLASSYHVIIANIDVRGTSGTGQNHMYPVNRNLGTVEVDDLIAVTEFLRNSSLGVVSFNQTQFNQKKVALIGMGYGGFLASMAYAKSTFFNCSIALSPITDWRYYDAVFTEKFMGLPTATDNLQGYKTANVSQYSSNFRNNTFFVAHGMADKAVHFQHSANLLKSLTNQNIQFRSLFYPDKGHNLLDSNVKKNLYQAMTDFLVDCLKLDEEPP